MISLRCAWISPAEVAKHGPVDNCAIDLPQTVGHAVCLATKPHKKVRGIRREHREPVYFWYKYRLPHRPATFCRCTASTRVPHDYRVGPWTRSSPVSQVVR